MFKVFINASDSIYEQSSHYQFVNYESFRNVLDKLLTNKVVQKESVEIHYSEYIYGLGDCVKKYIEERSQTINISDHPTGCTISYCKRHKMDGFILFENDCTKQSITHTLKTEGTFRGIPKRILYIDNDGNIINYGSI